ncbi:16S rRNA (cytosine(1402)-N(4))-methyltransferase RsmH [Acidithiobacillus thiooxidans]|uniref:Ribosomal RNA small subunit methyltransferase H n=1 Tax=Acidithiobacillus thiooxidans ATCC 19377 TaxID=637390 RepID=A0A543Q0M8_ACITH|nr:16S rRNA (cytosine(1402)-N(4))-methyltransferase RsmH [Acidithiobacillus thiooxidans]MDR7928117.1 16S rRNA (cytosine(1402)-N(4))-methyltransferase RsmH [Acidithiobacillus thiooxidans]MDX5933403.1 16S rRNA (cytosine(1402)-N(4))-methyltransferase RsmH [Acidithiobacillus thiooxidans]TQN49887.1 Ribosomal RNA small subunit methyltransferase H [Acidithiobacillus thiooxidans ATCC 19377]
MNIPASGSHITVLLQESVAMLQPALSEGSARRCVDVTGGRGGHSAALLEKLQHQDMLLILDRDPSAIAALQDRFADDERVLIRQARFSEIRSVLESLGWESVDAILADLGVSSPQLDEAERGFSFLRDGPLDMRMDPGSGISAAEWLNGAPETEIRQVLKNYGEERFARAIARKIVKYREQTPLQRTSQLAELIAEVIPRHDSGLNPATRSFQGIRIFINHELEELELFLPEAMAVLRAGGRLAIISFHSLEDRMVKRFFRADAFRVSSDLPLRAAEIPPLPWCAVGKAIHASTEEIQKNPRSRSAVLRVAERSERHAA